MELLNSNKDFFTIMAGTTRITFEKTFNKPNYHLCFRTNLDFFEIMHKKLHHEDVLLSNEKGQTSLFWKGKQAYFTDPDGNILEMLERPFSHKGTEPNHWFDIGEIGFPSRSVNEFIDLLPENINNTFKNKDDSFAFYGDDEGVFVLVKEGRPWYPTNKPATIHPIKVSISSNQPFYWKHPNNPIEIKSVPIWDDQLPISQMRFVRPTNNLAELQKFYIDGLNLNLIG
ncbi:hypothetical protein LC087_01975 [Bacillus carboniphilus]|uniref:VOC domain-containing protein n=1 Tax=Bacillus carboniphilus TaxID=86663 RepID=A0ABY9JW78_9BACI|nr:hypothetical protein [Bacillus carboniphilus]WLR43013.1 hypothetical protein LC087_01975 [Bacillus carboniphilus]